MLMTDAPTDVFEFDPQLTRSQKMQHAFGVSRKRLGELQDLRKTRLPTALEQRLGSANRPSKTSDRRRSNTLQAPAGLTRVKSAQDNISPGPSYGQAESQDSGFGSNLMGDQQGTNYKTNLNGTKQDSDYFQASVEPLTSDAPAKIMTEPVPSSQFPNVNWVSSEFDLANILLSAPRRALRSIMDQS